MTSGRQEGQQEGWADSFFLFRFLDESAAIVEVEVRKILRDATEMFSRAIQPVLWLVIFGQVFTKMRAIPTGSISYVAFLTPGILSQSILFSTIFYGISVIWERDLGIIHKLMVSPAHRLSLVFGKSLSAGFRGLVQLVIIYIVAAIMGVNLNFSPAAIAAVLLMVFLGSAVFSTFSLIIGCIVKTRERFMGMGQVLTMPLFFASSAIYPVSIMPAWLQWFAKINPLTYLVDSLRGIMIVGGQGAHSFGFDLLVMILVYAIFLAIADILYPTLIQ